MSCKTALRHFETFCDFLDEDIGQNQVVVNLPRNYSSILTTVMTIDVDKSTDNAALVLMNYFQHQGKHLENKLLTFLRSLI